MSESRDPNDPRTSGARGPRATERGEARTETSVGTLLRDLADDIADLVRKELALARNEIGSSISELKAGVGSVASGGGVLFAGLLYLLAAATYGLANVVDLWLAALIVGVIVTIIGYVMVKAGRKKFQAESFKPERTADALRKDKEMVQRRAS